MQSCSHREVPVRFYTNTFLPEHTLHSYTIGRNSFFWGGELPPHIICKSLLICNWPLIAAAFLSTSGAIIYDWSGQFVEECTAVNLGWCIPLNGLAFLNVGHYLSNPFHIWSRIKPWFCKRRVWQAPFLLTNKAPLKRITSTWPEPTPDGTWSNNFSKSSLCPP